MRKMLRWTAIATFSVFTLPTAVCQTWQQSVDSPLQMTGEAIESGLQASFQSAMSSIRDNNRSNAADMFSSDSLKSKPQNGVVGETTEPFPIPAFGVFNHRVPPDLTTHSKLEWRPQCGWVPVCTPTPCAAISFRHVVGKLQVRPSAVYGLSVSFKSERVAVPGKSVLVPLQAISVDTSIARPLAAPKAAADSTFGSRSAMAGRPLR